MFFNKLTTHHLFQVSTQGHFYQFYLFSWKQGFNVQLFGLSITYFFNRGKYQLSKQKGE